MPDPAAPEGSLPSDWPAILVGLIGSGIEGSRTPPMHEREGAEQRLRTIYRLIDLDVLGLDAGALPDLLTGAERLGFAGLNITHPCKQAVIPHLDELSPDARALGAVNTIVFRDGRRIGHNTDWWGFAESFRRELGDARRDRVALFGAGGAGAAVAHALLTLGTGELVVADPDEGRAGSLAASLCRRFGEGRARGLTNASDPPPIDGIVNATPLGMTAYPGMAVPPALLLPQRWVADIVYLPLETELLREARQRGCRTMSGAGMAVFQAAEAFGLFTGRRADSDRMFRHFRQLD